MTYLHKKRLLIIILVLFGISIAIALLLYGVKNKANWFITPTELYNKPQVTSNKIRIGGFVLPNSVKKQINKQQKLITFFVISDCKREVKVMFAGIVPDLFREKQGVIVEGVFFRDKKLIEASLVLAKHDENYMPKSIAKKLAEHQSKDINNICNNYQKNY